MSWMNKLWKGACAAADVVCALATTPSPPVVVGRGSANEVQVMIGELPHLFRDEGDSVVHFVAAFEKRLTSTRFGHKLLPSVAPHWEAVETISGRTISDAVSDAVRAHEATQGCAAPLKTSVAPADTPASTAGNTRQAVATPDGQAPRGEPASRRSGGARQHSLHVYHGKAAWWGEDDFPDRKRPGKTYRSFALRLDGPSGQQILQGEGLKDAITDAGCRLGDMVEVTRLRKVKVPAFTTSGDPKRDEHGNQVLWEKWLWSISRAH